MRPACHRRIIAKSGETARDRLFYDLIPIAHMIHLIDTHCHLTGSRFDADRESLIPALPEHGVWRAICIGTGIADAREVAALVARFPERLAGATGLDPHTCHEAGDAFAHQLAELDALLAGGTFVALGEIGIEYHHQLLPPATQISHFEAQLELAARRQLPVVIHVREGSKGEGRDAHVDTIAALARHPDNRGVIHSFAGNALQARAYLDLGWHLSFNGMLSYKGNDALREAARITPADRLLVETDAPYLPPMPHRGRRCDPGMVGLTSALLAEIRGERDDDVRAWTTRNACKLFGLELPPEWAAAKPHG